MSHGDSDAGSHQPLHNRYGACAGRWVAPTPETGRRHYLHVGKLDLRLSNIKRTPEGPATRQWPWDPMWACQGPDAPPCTIHAALSFSGIPDTRAGKHTWLPVWIKHQRPKTPWLSWSWPVMYLSRNRQDFPSRSGPAESTRHLIWMSVGTEVTGPIGFRHRARCVPARSPNHLNRPEDKRKAISLFPTDGAGKAVVPSQSVQATPAQGIPRGADTKCANHQLRNFLSNKMPAWPWDGPYDDVILHRF